MENTTLLNAQEKKHFLHTLALRFEKNMHRHAGIEWCAVEAKLLAKPEKLWSLYQMELSRGEPDVVQYHSESNQFIFFDCSIQSPAGRRSLCYDQEALEARKENKPQSSALKMAMEIGVEMLNEEEYRYLQTLGDFDTKTSSWVKTPSEIRSLGGAIFCDKRYNHIFTYHNGAESYYAARGFRASLKI